MRRLGRGAGVAASLLVTAAVYAQAELPADALLARFWTVHGALEDTNQDGLPDATRLRIEVRDPGDDAQLAAAANIAARLGFETMSMDLPLPAAAAGPIVLIGTPPPRSWLNLADASEPRGYVFVGGRDETVHLWGDDDEGLAAAALWLAGRSPRLWDAESLTVPDALARVLSWADDSALPLASATPVGVAIRVGVPGIDALFVDVRADRSGRRVVSALNAMEDGPALDGVRHVAFRVGGESAGEFTYLVSAGAPAEADGAPDGSGRTDLDLADLYTKQGLLSDSNGDEIPDGLNAVLSSTAIAGAAMRELAARLGLEASGVRLPVAVPPSAMGGAPPGTRVVIGNDHPGLVEIADEQDLPQLPADPNTGQVDVLLKAFGDDAAVTVRGADPGVTTATRYLAETAPYLGRRHKDAPTLATVRTDLRRFLARRSAAGQAAAAIDIAKVLLSELPTDASEIRLEVTVDKTTAGLDEYLQGIFGPAAELQLYGRDVQSAPEIWQLATELESEPEQLRRVVREKLYREAIVGEHVAVEARISEPLGVRQQLAEELETTLLELGANSAEVVVLPAYKQGFGWLEESVIPQLRGRAVDEIVIEYARNDPPADWPYQAMQTPTRWLLELFPIDEVLARELDLPLSAVEFRQIEPGRHTYRVQAWAAGEPIFGETFSPALVQRPYFEMYPNYEQVRVATGRVRAVVSAIFVLDEYLPTDLDRVWDLYQGKVLPALHDYTMRLHEGAPRAAYAPHFGELRARIALSEPDRALGVDQEQIAPLEALHEEIYFGTLHFFDLLGRVASGSALSYPGRVIPIVEPLKDGEPGRVEFSLTGFSSPVARVEVGYTSSAGRLETLRRDLPPLDVATPTVRSLRVRKPDELASIGLSLKVDEHREERAQLLLRHRERQVDGSWVTSERLRGALAELRDMRSAGIYDSELAYEGAPDLDIGFGTGFAPEDGDVTHLLHGNGNAAPPVDPSALVAATDATHRVQWSTPMAPAEAHSILAVMAQEFDEASLYQLGTSYLGKTIWGLDLMAPLPGTHWSQAKATALKPTVVYSARQHANEVSSTSHVLRMAEMLLTDETWRSALQRLNVVIHPMTNPDGAQLAFDLHQITPNHMLHAGYLGSLGVDVTAGSGEEDPVYPETSVRERLWQTWLPDIFLNPHGYPSHEWVQPFSEYAGWVRHRTTQSRDWWGMRGWFMPGFQFLDDPEYPRHREHAFRIRDEITSSINALPEIVELNRRAYARYRRYGHAADPATFRLNFADDVLIYTSMKGSRAGGPGWMTRNPKVTIWSGSTEAPDETASGDWLELVASAGLAWDQAVLRYLLALEHPVERKLTSWDGGVSIRLHRERPGVVPERNE